MQLDFTIETLAGRRPARFDISALVVGGWAGRDKAAMEHHIRELEALGVRRPASTPVFYRVAASRLTTAAQIECTGGASSGEVETVILAQNGALFVGVGSDHTDREVETYGITVSKQLCDKPVSKVLWPLDEVADHWDSLILRAWIIEGGARVAYQDGSVAGLLDPRDLIALYTSGGTLAEGTAMFGGTSPAIGGIRPSGRFEAELHDPVLGRSLHCAYDIVSLPIAG
jgi:hypothetical protein